MRNNNDWNSQISGYSTGVGSFWKPTGDKIAGATGLH
jgi:hypothetical protein